MDHPTQWPNRGLVLASAESSVPKVRVQRDWLLLCVELAHSAGDVFIDATEYGDVLALSGASYMIGVEIPDEMGTQSLEQCGQSMTFPFFMRYDNSSIAHDEGIPTPSPLSELTLEGYNWDQIWAYRRSIVFLHFATALNFQSTGQSWGGGLFNGDVSNQNWGGGNDFKSGYLFLTRDAASASSSDWKGGLNLTVLKAAEDQAFAWYHFFKNVSSAPSHISLARDDIVGTKTGLSKVPYIRDTRRSVGADGFRLFYANFSADGHPSKIGDFFHDVIAIGDYPADVHGILNCSFPVDISRISTVPYFLPFRALTNADVTNLLVCGKTMAQSFHANSATRLHPVEWSSGAAAGVVSSFMSGHGVLSSVEVFEHIREVQQRVRKFNPLDWKL